MGNYFFFFFLLTCINSGFEQPRGHYLDRNGHKAMVDPTQLGTVAIQLAPSVSLERRTAESSRASIDLDTNGGY